MRELKDHYLVNEYKKQLDFLKKHGIEFKFGSDHSYYVVEILHNNKRIAYTHATLVDAEILTMTVYKLVKSLMGGVK